MKMSLPKKIALACAVFVLLVAIGYVRLPYAAVASLLDYDLTAGKPVFYGNIEASIVQQWWLRMRVPCQGQGTGPPSINVSVRWNWVFVARVESGVHIGPLAAEGRDSLYVWCLGAWMRVHDYNHEMA